jgi:hypothetical protein
MSTFPAEMVRLGSIFRKRQLNLDDGRKTYHDSDKRILIGLVINLCIDIDTRKPATITGMGVIPANGMFQSSCLFLFVSQYPDFEGSKAHTFSL